MKIGMLMKKFVFFVCFQIKFLTVYQYAMRKVPNFAEVNFRGTSFFQLNMLA